MEKSLHVGEGMENTLIRRSHGFILEPTHHCLARASGGAGDELVRRCGDATGTGRVWGRDSAGRMRCQHRRRLGRNGGGAQPWRVVYSLDLPLVPSEMCCLVRNSETATCITVSQCQNCFLYSAKHQDSYSLALGPLGSKVSPGR